MTEIIGTHRWMIACRPVNKQGIWNMLFAEDIYRNEELAALAAVGLMTRQLDEDNHLGYAYKPIQVFINPVGVDGG